MDNVTLLINGLSYEGWKEVSISRNMKSICGSFSLTITDQWNYTGKPWQILQGDRAEVFIGSEKVLTGYVDKVNPSYSATSKSLTVEGRDITSDLVDCSADHGIWVFKDYKLDRMIQFLCKPFGLTVVKQTNVGASFSVWPIHRSETVIENIQTAAKKRGVLIVTDENGQVLIVGNKKQRAATALVEGQNILSAEGSYDQSKRFSRYRICTQAEGSTFLEEDNVDAEELMTQVEAISTDVTVKRFRPLVVVMESQGAAADAKIRANWEATVRAAQSTACTITVQGWRQGDGSLWKPNFITPVQSQWLGLNQDMLIVSVEWTLNEGGTMTRLSLEGPESYIPEPTIREDTGLWKELN